MTLDADTTIYRFGCEQNAWCLNASRVAQTSSLYDLPGRSTVGFAFVYAVVADVLRSLDGAMPRRELAAALRRPLVRPNPLQALIVLEAWLMGRERLLIDGGNRLPVESERDRADWELVGSWYAEVVGAMRGEDAFPPPAADGGEQIEAQPVLAPLAWRELGAEGDPLPVPVAERIERAAGALDLFALTLHGEQRDGLFDRGPHRAADGRSVVLHEVNDLRNDVLPWSTEVTRLGVDAIGVLRAYRPATAVRVDMWGTAIVRPTGPADQVLAVWARRGEELFPLGVEELERIAARATAATAELFGRMAGWDGDYRTAYGGPLFANHLIPLVRAAGRPDLVAPLLERADRIAATELNALRGAEPHPVWKVLVRTDSDVLFTAPAGSGVGVPTWS